MKQGQDHELVESMLGDEFTFPSPVHVGLDRPAYFERCWPGSGQRQRFEFVRLVEAGDEVIVTSEMTRAAG